MSVEVSETKQERKRRVRSGIPADPDLRQPWPKRLITNRLFWLSALLLVVYAVLLVLLYQRVVPDQEVPAGPSRASAPRPSRSPPSTPPSPPSRCR